MYVLKMPLLPRLRPGSRWGAPSAPRLPSWIRGGKKGKGWEGKGREGKGGEGRGGEIRVGRGGEGKGSENSQTKSLA